MKFASIAVASLAFALSALAGTSKLGYDDHYGIGSTSLSTTACSNGENGLMTRGYTTLDSLPTYPYVTSSYAVPGWNSPQCGACWNLSYTDNTGKTNSIKVTVIDHAQEGWYTTVAAMDDLTSGHALEYGLVDIVTKALKPVDCGL
ncbi:cerato-platanin-related secreted protein [Mucidula mucida]|nr:cerato-platanin-related secreted protein [Mucidula mucida]